MTDSIVSPYFKEDFYKGQDVVHYGIRIPLKLSLEEILAKFSRRARRILRDDSFKAYWNSLTTADLPTLRKLWFDPNDPTFPDTMDGHIGYLCRLPDGEVLGGIILTPAGKNVFLHQLVSGEKGKELGVPTMLIWGAIKCLKEFTNYHSIDIGVSYNPKRYAFFENFAVEKYPIILKKPFYVPVIRLSPFRSFEESQALEAHRPPFNRLDNNTTFVPRGVYGIYALLKHLNLQPEDEVCIQKTFGSNYIARCVTDTIEKVCHWKLRELTSRTKVILVIHEFGIPCRDVFVQPGIPIIEDCAWRIDRVLPDSNYQVYSLQKMFNVNYGGLIQGVKLTDEFLWSIGCLDVVKRGNYLREKDYIFSAYGSIERPRLWNRYYELAMADGMEMDDCYDYKTAVDNCSWTPTVFLQKFKDNEEANAVVERLQEFGIQAGRYWGEPVVFLPIHQNMSLAEVEYMFAVVKGYFNLCADWKGK